MGRESNIEWTHHTFNPWMGCQKVSPGCKHCYAERYTRRMAAERRPEWGPHPRIRTAESTWRAPLTWNRDAERAGQRQRVFCASLADVFDPRAPAAWGTDLWALIAATPALDWLLLTKRIENVADMVPAHWLSDWPAHVWLGISVCTQSEADRDIPRLLRLPAPVRFLSCEPLLGPVDLAYSGFNGADSFGALPGIHWVIAGGESGPQARPSHPDWFRVLRDQCARAHVPFLFKQWGEWAPDGGLDAATLASCFVGRDGAVSTTRTDGAWMFRRGKAAAGRLLDGRTWDEVPRP
jgi:protein gp37